MVCLLSVTLLTSARAADVTILNQRVRDCSTGSELLGTVNLGEKVEARLQFLISNEKEIVLYSQLEKVTFYLDEDIISTNSTAIVTLSPGSYSIRAVGEVPHGIDGEKIQLIASDNIAKYVTATLSSPYLLKTSALFYTAAVGLISAIIAGLVVYVISRGRIRQQKSRLTKESDDILQNTRKRLMSFFKLAAPNLNDIQRKEAKKLLQELGEGK